MKNKSKQLTALQNTFNKVVHSYIVKFCKKQDLEFDFWVADEIATVAFFGDYSFDFDEVRFDVDTNQKKGKILEWQGDSVDNHFAGKQTIDYKNYCKQK